MSASKLKFEFIDHTADAGIKVFGANISELFENSALGLFDIICDLDKVNPQLQRELTVDASDKESLLVNWLSELNFIFLTERILFKQFEIQEIRETWLSAVISGEPLNLDKHEIYTEVKAVTFHELYIKESRNNWEAQIIFDL